MNVHGQFNQEYIIYISGLIYHNSQQQYVPLLCSVLAVLIYHTFIDQVAFSLKCLLTNHHVQFHIGEQ